MIVFHFKGMGKVWQRFYFLKKDYSKKMEALQEVVHLLIWKSHDRIVLRLRVKEKSHLPACVIRPAASHRAQVEGTHPLSPGSHSLPFPVISFTVRNQSPQGCPATSPCSSTPSPPPHSPTPLAPSLLLPFPLPPSQPIQNQLVCFWLYGFKLDLDIHFIINVRSFLIMFPYVLCLVTQSSNSLQPRWL